MLLNPTDVVLISHRRMFLDDETRFFLGRVAACEGELLKVEGFSFVRDFSSGEIMRKEEKRTKVLSLASAGYIIYQLPLDVNVERARIKSDDGDTTLVDGARELMNLSERAHCGHF